MSLQEREVTRTVTQTERVMVCDACGKERRSPMNRAGWLDINPLAEGGGPIPAHLHVCSWECMGALAARRSPAKED